MLVLPLPKGLGQNPGNLLTPIWSISAHMFLFILGSSLDHYTSETGIGEEFSEILF